ncbi:UNVERIFIED_CONTAM: hypothetical protein Sradi_5650100 [Sesamum radiatum]|uniref:MULE transposase domain-containing protein n=1 Tax=Sesamum radiatum TaxID=300843 RepID=A0AAW2L1L6_SESRA
MDISIDVFVEVEKLPENTELGYPGVGEWGTYMSMLTQDLPSLPVVTEAMGGFGLDENYSGSSSYATPSNYAGPSDNAVRLYVGQSNYAEPDEVEEEDQMPANHENDDEVSIDIMMDVLGNNADAPTTPVDGNFDLNMPTGSVPPYNLYPVPAFFRTTHPEIPADSIDVPTEYDCNSFDGYGSRRPNFAIKNVRQTIKDKFGFEIPYHKAWQALKAAREQIYGTWESSVQKLPRYMSALQKWNPGTVVEWYHLDTDRPGLHMLNYVFWAFRPCIQGFRYCRNVISVDGTHLYTRYKHKLLVAVTLDANNQVLPLAFALVDEETLASWTWFLQMLARHFLPNEDDRVCLISDRHPGLINAINYVPAFKFPRGVHRFCLRHVCSNFNNKYKNVQLKDLCWRAGSESSARKFDRIMEEIKSLNPEAYDWLGNIDKTQWTLAHDGGWRTGF